MRRAVLPQEQRRRVLARARWRGRTVEEWHAATHGVDDTPGRHRNDVPRDEQPSSGTAYTPGAGS